jgi:hypothetical protein
MARRERRKFTDEFKAGVVALVRSAGKSIEQISCDLDLTETAVREWVRRAEVDGGVRDGFDHGFLRFTNFELKAEGGASALVRTVRTLAAAGVSDSITYWRKL